MFAWKHSDANVISKAQHVFYLIIVDVFLANRWAQILEPERPAAVLILIAAPRMLQGCFVFLIRGLSATGLKKRLSFNSNFKNLNKIENQICNKYATHHISGVIFAGVKDESTGRGRLVVWSQELASFQRLCSDRWALPCQRRFAGVHRNLHKKKWITNVRWWELHKSLLPKYHLKVRIFTNLDV